MFFFKLSRLSIAVSFALATPMVASAATLCVAPDGAGGCSPTIAGALAMAATGDTIAVAAGTYNEGGLLVNKSVVVRGAGVGATIVDGSGIVKSVFKYPDFQAPVTSTISGLTIRGGARGVDIGGGNVVTVEDARVTANGPWTGAGIFNGASILHVKRTLIDGNSATDIGSMNGCDWGGGSGGGIGSLCGGGWNYVTDSAIVGNVASRWGGGLIVNDGHTEIVNTTISGNAANFPDAGLAGGALFVGGGFPEVTVRFSTIAFNTAVGAGGIQGSEQVSLYASLVQGNTGHDCNGPIASLGYNVVSDASCAFGGVGDAVSTDAQLAPLALVGGSTPLHAFTASSPAVDRVPASVCNAATDQDGVSRPQHGACDSGSYEHVFTAPELIADLMADVAGVGPGGSISGKLSLALAQASGGNAVAACGTLGALRNEVAVQTGKKIPAAVAASMQSAIFEIRMALACPA